VARLIVARVLNHADRSVTGIDGRHEYLAKQRQALDAWGRYVQNLIQSCADNVIALRT
jgi:hypothetical protein